jgi:hypothetical protein
MALEMLEMEYDDDDEEVVEMTAFLTSEKSALPKKVPARDGRMNCSKRALVVMFIATIVLLAGGFLSSFLRPLDTINVRLKAICLPSTK